MKQTQRFLIQLEKNNNREWFNGHKDLYEQSRIEMLGFVEKLIAEVSKHDQVDTSASSSLMRIYRDVRFSKDKTPYKTNWGGGLKRTGVERRGGYYYQVGVGHSFVMGGFFGPNKEDLWHIRRQMAADPDALREILQSKMFKDFFGQMIGAQLKTSPRGFDKQHPALDLIRYKQFMVKHEFSQSQMMSEEFPSIVSLAFLQMRPFFDYMSEILTTNLNGESLI